MNPSKKTTLHRRPNALNNRTEQNQDSTSGFKDPVFPTLKNYPYEIVETKTIHAGLTIVYVGTKRPESNRIWGLSLSTPSCLIENLYAQRDGTTSDRFLLTPDYYNSNHGSEFNAFLDSVEGVSETLKELFANEGYDIGQWKSPVRKNRGVVEGLQVKVRFPFLAQKAREVTGPVRTVIKLSCAYFTPDRSGLSFEMVDTSTEQQLVDVTKLE